MALNVKGKPASAHQTEMMKLIVTTTRGRGGDMESCAGAVATAIQESSVTNMSGGDRDSQGLYQQRPSMGWGSVAQIRTPSYAIGKFLDLFLGYRRQGIGWLQASHKTQRSAHPSAPAKWYPEGVRAAQFFTGSEADGTAGSTLTAGGGESQETRIMPYEFSRGSADKKETSWECSGRLADEVQWRRFMRGGEFWYVSDDWLAQQDSAYRLSEHSQGVVDLSFEFETRSEATQATLRCQTRRYGVLPGDVVELEEEGPADGKWLVSAARRNVFSAISEVTLVRKRPKLPEPAPRTETVTVGDSTGGSSVETGSGDVNPNGTLAEKAYAAAELYSSWRAKYSQPRRNGLTNGPFSTGDCSSGVSWVLWKAGIPLPGGAKTGGWAPSTHAYPGWGQKGNGKFFTVMVNYQTHIWIRWNGVGSAWRFDTGGGLAPHQQSSPRGSGGFVAHHWQGC